MNELTGILGTDILRVGAADHSQLTGTDNADSHPMSAITGLVSALNAKASLSDIPTALSELDEDASHSSVTLEEKALWNGKSDFSGAYNDLTGKPQIPSLAGYATESYVNTCLSGYYDKNYLDTIFDDYIDGIAGLIGGDA